MIQNPQTNLEDFYNLPFVLAYAVLDECLSELVTQRVFACSDRNIGPKMKASQGAITWKDYHLVDTGRDRRNDVAHRAELQSKADCLRYIQAIEDELKAWGVM